MAGTIEDKCDECEKSVAFGSGLFIDRISTDEGWLCVECQGEECDLCGERTAQFTIRPANGAGHATEVVCEDCC